MIFSYVAFSQITINVESLEYEIGGYYKMYDIEQLYSVSYFTGMIGGPLLIDFSNYSTTNIRTYEYVNISDSGNQNEFPYADIAERIYLDDDIKWTYLKFEPEIGRINYGSSFLYDPDLVAMQIHDPPIIDFPDSLTYQSYFEGSGNIEMIPNIPEYEFEYNYNGFVDAYGSLILPDSLGVHDFIRLNYESDSIIYFMGIPQIHHYFRTYYYLVDEIGIAVIINALHDSSPIPDNFDVASSFARCFEYLKEPINHIDDNSLDDYSLIIYPNPFHTETTISFSSTEVDEGAEIEIYNIKGQKIKQFSIDDSRFSIDWNGKDKSGNAVSSGIYFLKLKTGKNSLTKKMILMR